MPYQYNPHAHTKIWLSNNPSVFMNLENQIRLIEMREKNPDDTIYLVYDAKLLNTKSISDLYEFCKENNICPIDADQILKQLHLETERKLYEFYKSEINHLNSGGNLGVASDILRWLPPVFRCGTYTDFDFPIDTNSLPPLIKVDSPLLLNIGSLKMGKKEFILANNDYIALVDETAAEQKIRQIQNSILKKLTRYDNDFIEKTERELSQGAFFNRYLLQFMKNRPESLYIFKSKKVNRTNTPGSSLKVRDYCNQVMNNTNKFIEFNRINSGESDEEVIQRLRNDLKKQLNMVKYLFFNKEYAEIKNHLEQNNTQFLEYLMQKEHDLYLKSIVVCTTGPIEISNALFDHYVVNTDTFAQEVQPLSFNHYGLQKAFQSQNSLPLHENVFGMLKFLGVKDGELNDSSWLDSGKKLQKRRTDKLSQRQKELEFSLPDSLLKIKSDIKVHIKKMEKNTLKNRAEIDALEHAINCFDPEESEFDIAQFKKSLPYMRSSKKNIFSGFFLNQTEKLIDDLNHLCHDALIFSLAKNKKIKIRNEYSRHF